MENLLGTSWNHEAKFWILWFQSLKKNICTAWTPVTVPSFDPIAEVEEATTVACRALEVDHSWKGELRAHLTLGIWQWMAMGIFAQIEETIEYEAQM